MFNPRALRSVIITSLGFLAVGCQSTSTVGSRFRGQGTAVARTQESMAPAAGLDQGMEVQWQVYTARNEPGQVHGGQGMIGPDGTMVIGPYGTCKVAGLTMDQATVALENHLAAYLQAPRVRLTTSGPNQQMDLAWRPARETTGTGASVAMPAGETAHQPVTSRPGVVPASQNNKVCQVSGETAQQVMRGERVYVQDAGGTVSEAAVARPGPFARLRSFFRGGSP